MSPVRFVSPWFLAIIPVAVGLLLWGTRQSYVRFARGRRVMLITVRALIIALLAAVLARPMISWKTRDPSVVLLVDVSASMTDAWLAEAGRYARALAAAQPRLEVVTFARHPRRLEHGNLKIERHDSGETNLAEALLLASSLGPSGPPRVVLLSDGNDPRAIESAQRAAEAGVQVDVVKLGGVPIDARVTAVSTSNALRQHQPARFSITVESTRAGAATLQFEENDVVVRVMADQQLKVGSQTIEVDHDPTVGGRIRYAARVVLADDAVPGNDRYAVLLQVNGEPRVLLLSRTPDEGTYLEEALRTQEISVVAASSGGLPSTLDELLAYDAVLMAGVAPWEFDRIRQAALMSYVRDTGGGLLFVSGRQGLRRDPQGQASALESILPVEMVAPSERELPPVALALLIDRSGSMNGEKLDYAKKAALAVIEKLSPQDQLGVVGFDARFDWIVPMQPVRDKDELKKKVGDIGSGGGTRFYPALEDAYFTLGSTEATVRHVILLTDGISTDPNIFPELLAKMRTGHITVSTVAIGGEADAKLLKEIAQLGGGRFTQTANANQVPNIFIQEAETLQRDAAQRVESKVRVAALAREIQGIDFAGAPPLKGYLRTRAKATSETLLETGQSDPLLVRWRYGLGEVVAFTSDATSIWSELWLRSGWSGFNKLWAQLVRGVERVRGHRDLSLTLTEGDDVIWVAVDAIDASGRFLNDLAVSIRVIDTSQQVRELALRQTGPGRYEGRLSQAAEGTLLALPVGLRGGRRFEGEWAILARPYPKELLKIGVDAATLARIATIAHGRELTDPGQITSDQARPAVLSAAGPLAMLAALLFMIDVVLRRARRGGPA